MNRPFAWLLPLLILASACAPAQKPTATTTATQTANIPAIDAAAPADFETATFALG